MTIPEFKQNFKYAFRPHKPRLFFRLASALAKSKIFHKPPLRYVDFAIDFDCNLRCNHCFATALKKSGKKQMAPEDYSRVAEECMKLGTVNFSFQGGEPLMFKNLPAIIKSCKPDRNVISVTTNGTLLNKDKIQQLKEIGVDILTISLDSSIAKEHDAFRGMAGAFEKTISGIKTALKEGLNVTLGTVVTHQTLKSEGINGIIKLALELKLNLNLILPVPIGRWHNNQEIALNEEDLNYIDALTKKHAPYVRTDFQANLGEFGCGAAKEILYLTPYGDVLVCPFIHISFGNIFEDSIETIRKRALQNPYLSYYHQKCLASTDKEFIEKYLNKTYNSDDLPLKAEKVFNK
ncbi:MAG: radical SAM protein [Elusimicrobia bacterium]|nr:radical SAM protein [Elusimicrobiota bacterium]